MLTLIGREIRDHMVYLVALCLVAAIMIAVLIAAAYEGVEGSWPVPLGLLVLVLLLGFGSLGAGQMYGDRANRISPLLSTLAVTRSRILAARVLVGILAVLAATVPVILTAIFLLRLFVPPIEFYQRMVVEISVTTVLLGIACYCIGLLVGGTTNKAWLLGGNLLLLALCVSIVGAKGFGPEAMLVLAVLSAALLVCTWRKFISASL